MQPDQRSPLDRQHAQPDVSKVGDGAGTGALPGQKKRVSFSTVIFLKEAWLKP